MSAVTGRVTIVVCGDRWDLEKSDPRDLIHHMMTTVMDPRSSLEVLKRNSQSLADLLIEIRGEVQTLPAKSRRLWRNHCTKIAARLNRLALLGEQDQAVTMIYNCLLSLEGLGLLGGFSVRGKIDKGLMNYNPERKSIMSRY